MTILVKIALQSAAYLVALSWLAWSFERTRGYDAFHLVVAFVSGVLVSTFAYERGLGAMVCVLLGSAVAFAVDRGLGRLASGLLGHGGTVVMIATASLSLLMFDWMTAYTPLTMATEGAELLTLATIAWCVGAAVVVAQGRTRLGRNLRLGLHNQWAPAYWGGSAGYHTAALALISAVAWLSVLTYPLATTGLLSSTLLKDVTLGILIARIVGSGHVLRLLGVCTTLATLRVGAAYLVTTPLALPIVDGAVFVALFLWLRYRSDRTAWKSHAAR